VSAPLIYVDLIKSHPAPREKFPSMTDERYRELVERYQPWRLLILSGDNHEPMFKSTESYHNKVDAIHAAELAFGANSNVWLRESEHESRALRLVFSVAADEDTLDAINAPDLDLAIDAAEDAAADDEWPVGEVQG